MKSFLCVNEKFKQTTEYLLRVFVFLLLNRNYAFDFSAGVFLFLFNPLIKAANGLIDSAAFAVLFVVFHIYICAKICGLFKKLDSIGFYKALFIIFFVEILRILSLGLTVGFSPLKISYAFKEDLIMLPFLYILYKFLYFVTKGTIFEKIGSCFSIEFYKNLFKSK